MNFPIHTADSSSAKAILSSQTKKKDVLHKKLKATGVMAVEEYEQRHNHPR